MTEQEQNTLNDLSYIIECHKFTGALSEDEISMLDEVYLLLEDKLEDTDEE